MTDNHDVAWLIWCARQGHVDKELRQFLIPWIRKPDHELYPEDIRERELCLALADEVIEKVREITKPVRADVDVLMDSAGNEIWCGSRDKLQRRITKWTNVLQRHGPLASMRVSLAGDGLEVNIAEYLELKSGIPAEGNKEESLADRAHAPSEEGAPPAPERVYPQGRDGIG